MVHFAPVSEAVLEAGVDLKAVFVARAGYENVNVEEAGRRGVAVVNIQGRNADAVAEQAVGFMIAVPRNIVRADARIKAGHWGEDLPGPVHELGGRTVGLVGYGHVGRRLARRLSGPTRARARRRSRCSPRARRSHRRRGHRRGRGRCAGGRDVRRRRRRRVRLDRRRRRAGHPHNVVVTPHITRSTATTTTTRRRTSGPFCATRAHTEVVSRAYAPGGGRGRSTGGRLCAAGSSHRVASGGTVTTADAGSPCQAEGSARTAPRLPTLPPP